MSAPDLAPCPTQNNKTTTGGPDTAPPRSHIQFGPTPLARVHEERHPRAVSLTPRTSFLTTGVVRRARKSSSFYLLLRSSRWKPFRLLPRLVAITHTHTSRHSTTSHITLHATPSGHHHTPRHHNTPTNLQGVDRAHPRFSKQGAIRAGQPAGHVGWKGTRRHLSGEEGLRVPFPGSDHWFGVDVAHIGYAAPLCAERRRSGASGRSVKRGQQ